MSLSVSRSFFNEYILSRPRTFELAYYIERSLDRMENSNMLSSISLDEFLAGENSKGYTQGGLYEGDLVRGRGFIHLHNLMDFERGDIKRKMISTPIPLGQCSK